MPTDSTALLKASDWYSMCSTRICCRARRTPVSKPVSRLAGSGRRPRVARLPITLWCAEEQRRSPLPGVLSVVFVRTLEDRGFLARRRIAGPGAEDSERQFTALAPFLTPRDYLLMCSASLQSCPAPPTCLMPSTTRLGAGTVGRCGSPAARLLSSPWEEGRSPANFRRRGHAFSRGSVPEAVRGRAQALCVASNTGVRRGVHSRPNPRSSNEGLRP